jgi:hypothetical protein
VGNIAVGFPRTSHSAEGIWNRNGRLLEPLVSEQKYARREQPKSTS